MKLVDNAKCKYNHTIGMDGLASTILKVAAHVIAPAVTKIIYLSIITGMFLTLWKLASVCPIFKGKCGTN